MTANGEVLRVDQLTIRRGSVLLLQDICWRVQRGEHWVILGANGSGKTSLLSALTGYLTPTEGSVQLLGKEFGCTDWRALRVHVGIVSSSIRQMMPDYEPALITVASGRYAMIDFWGTPSRQDRVRARRILKQIECEDLESRPWLYLSQGERQRILIGRALMAQPRLLILDEPCAGLDPAARERFLHFLDRLSKQPKGPSLILVTHHVEEITPGFSHSLILKEGRIQAQGKTPKVLSSQSLSEAFDTRATLQKQKGRYELKIHEKGRRIA